MNAKKAAEGLELVAIGGILLANTAGGLPWSVWLSVLSLWPVWLVALGIDLIGKSTDRMWLRVLSSLLLIAALLYGAFVMAPGTWGSPFVIRSTVGSEAVNQTQPHSDAVESGVVQIGVGATDLTVDGGDDLASLTGDSPAGLTPQLTTKISEGAADVRLDYRRGSTIWIPGSATNRLRLALDKAVHWGRLEFDAGATKAHLDLTDLKVDEVAASVGAADTTITFAEEHDCSAEIAGGVANIMLRVPKSSKVTLEATGLLNVRVPSGFSRSGGWGSRTYTYNGGGSEVIGITINGGIANVAVETY
jgi:hypothetical protein